MRLLLLSLPYDENKLLQSSLTQMADECNQEDSVDFDGLIDSVCSNIISRDIKQDIGHCSLIESFALVASSYGFPDVLLLKADLRIIYYLSIGCRMTFSNVL
ncbi:hypothetical protein Tco_1238227 [Tanacetum coccineum]